MLTWRGLHARVRDALGEPDARRVMERASGLDGAALVAAGDDPVPGRVIPFVDALVERRQAGEPLQYVVGSWGFRRLDLFVDRRVLIPRPETETVVEVALAEAGRALGAGDRVLDLGTGSGAIALALATEIEGVEVWAVDASAEALAVARANTAATAGRAAPRVRLVEGSWYEPLPEDLAGSFGLIVSNPPYVADGEDLPDEVAAWEPTAALRSGPTGLEAVEQVVAGAPRWLAPGGVLVVEHAPHQSADIRTLATGAGLVGVRTATDLTGRERALVARAPERPGDEP